MPFYTANVLQEDLHRQGRKITEFEKKSDALSRKRHYETELKSTMLRLRGSFADVILGAKNELQASVDKSFVIQSVEMEKTFTKQLLDVEKSYTKKAIVAEHSFAAQLKEKDDWLTKKTKELEESYQKKLEQNRDNTNIEIARINSQLNQSMEETKTVQSQVGMIHTQMAQEREGYRQAIANVEKGRDDTITKLSSTLETLQNTCASAQSLEMKLQETEMKLHGTEERLDDIQSRFQYENEMVKQENERAALLERKLINVQNEMETVMNVQKEMETHLILERERADLLQRELHSEAQTRQEIVASLQDTDRQRRAELECATRDRKELEHTSKQCSSLMDNLNSMQGKFQEQVAALHESKQEYMQQTNEFEVCKDRLIKTSEMSSLLDAKVAKLEAKIEDQDLDLEAARLSEADVEQALAENLQRNNELQQRVDAYNIQVKEMKGEISVLEEMRIKTNQFETENNCLLDMNKEIEKERDTLMDNCQRLEEEHSEERNKIAQALKGFDEEMTTAEEKLQDVLKLNAQLEAEKEAEKEVADKQLESLNEKVENLMNDVATSEATRKSMTTDERKNMEEKHKAGITVYEETISILKKRVEHLEQLSEAGDECISCVKNSKLIRAEMRGEIRRELQEELQYEANDDQLRELIKSKEDLANVRNEKAFLEGSLERSIQYIKDMKRTQHELNSTNDLEDAVQEACATIVAQAPGTFQQVTSEIDAFLVHIEGQLPFGQCGPHHNLRFSERPQQLRPSPSKNKEEINQKIETKSW